MTCLLWVVGICEAYLWKTSWKEEDSEKSGVRSSALLLLTFCSSVVSEACIFKQSSSSKCQQILTLHPLLVLPSPCPWTTPKGADGTVYNSASRAHPHSPAWRLWEFGGSAIKQHPGRGPPALPQLLAGPPVTVSLSNRIRECGYRSPCSFPAELGECGNWHP